MTGSDSLVASFLMLHPVFSSQSSWRELEEEHESYTLTVVVNSVEVEKILVVYHGARSIDIMKVHVINGLLAD